MSSTYNEMKEQYNALIKTFDYLATKKEEIIHFYKINTPKSIIYIGCGSSYCLCRSGEFSALKRLGVRSTALAAGDLMLNFEEYRSFLDGTLIIAPSRSGSTSEVIKAVEKVKSLISTKVLSISCVKDSPLSGISDFPLELPWANDDSVCQTRTVTNLYTANLLIMAYLSSDEELVEQINKAINTGNDYMNEYEDKIRQIAELEWSNVVLLADGEMQGIAAEAAIAFTEIAKISGHYYHVLDVRHGPMVLVNKDTVVIVCITEEGYVYQKSLIGEILGRGAKVITYSDIPLQPIEGVHLQITSSMKLDKSVQGIPYIFISQALACFKADKLGINPDNPDGLTAWVKL